MHKQFSACVVLKNSEGLILGVTRKTDHSRYDFPGGKQEEGETPQETAIREIKEETGLDIFNLKLVHIGNREVSYSASWKGELDQERIKIEGHLVKWCTEEEILLGHFAKYNKIVLDKLR